MTTHATLDTTSLAVTPGNQVICTLTVANGGAIVESYSCEVMGDAAPWSRVEPAEFSLYPGADAQVVVTFAPPRSTALPAGDVPFAVHVVPARQPDRGVAPEGVLRVLPYAQTTVELTPHMSRARRGARHGLAIDNRGNIPLRVAFAATDPDSALTLRVRPEILTIAPGHADFATVRLVHRRRLWRGDPVSRQFQVVVQPETDEARLVDATAVQVPLISRATGRLAMLGLTALMLLAGIWFGVVKPAAESAAEKAVAEPIAEVAKVAQEAKASAAVAISQPDVTGNPTVPPVAPATTGAPFSRRLETIVSASTESGNEASTRFTVPEKTVLTLTDLLLQNPQPDTGVVNLLVDGKVVLTVNLADFRFLDFHLVTPIEVPEGKVVSMKMSCTSPGPALPGFTGAQCRGWILLSGSTRVAAT